MSKTITVHDLSSQTSEQVVTEATTALELFGNDRATVAARVNGKVVDLATELADGDEVEPVAATSDEGLAILRHSCAHVAAQAVQRLHADAKLGIGPPITDGFYYDFDVATPFTPEDLKAIEKEMGSIVKERQRSCAASVTDDDAAAELAAEPYKLELIGLKGSARRPKAASVEVGAGELTIYDNVRRDGAVAWKDLCRGPHVPHTGYLATATPSPAAPPPTGAATRRTPSCSASTAPPGRPRTTWWPTTPAWRRPPGATTASSASNSTCSASPRSSGAGLPVFHPKGGVIKRVMEDYVRTAHIRRRLPVRRHPAHLQGGPVPHLRAPAVLRRRHVPAHGRRRAELLPQGHELPDAQPDLQVARAVLP